MPSKPNEDHSFTKIDLEKKPSFKKKPIARKKVTKKKVVKPARNTTKVVGGKAAPKKKVESLKDKKVNRELNDIYKNDDGSMPNMKNFKRKKSGGLFRAFMVLIIASAFLAGVAWVGFFVFQPQLQFAEKDVVLEIEGNEDITAGQEVKYRIRYRNSQNMPLSKVVLQVRYPEGFVFEDSSVPPTNDKKDEWTLGSLEEHASGYIDIYGRLYGDLSRKQSFRAFLNYYPSNFSSEFQKVFSLNTEVTESPVELNIKAIEEVVPGTETEFILEFTVADEIGRDNLAIMLEPSGGFAKTGSSIDSDEENEYLWSLASVGEENKLVIKGSFNPEGSVEDVKMIFKVVGWKDSERQVDPYVYLNKEIDIKLLKTDLAVNLAINGSLSDITVEPGEILNTSVVLRNAGEAPLKNVSVRLVYETPSYDNLSMLDWYELDDSADGDILGDQINAQTRRGIISWTSRHIKDLAVLEPGEELNIDLHIPFKDSADLDLTRFVSTDAKAFVEVKYENAGEQKLLTSNEIGMMVNSDMDFEVRDKISENDANKEVHTITWLLANTYHELKDIEIKADIYGDITWDEESLTVPAGEAVWDKKSQTLVWKVDSMPTSVDVLALQFSFVLNTKNPSQTNLTSKVNIRATDVITESQILKVGDEILLTE